VSQWTYCCYSFHVQVFDYDYVVEIHWNTYLNEVYFKIILIFLKIFAVIYDGYCMDGWNSAYVCDLSKLFTLLGCGCYMSVCRCKWLHVCHFGWKWGILSVRSFGIMLDIVWACVIGINGLMLPCFVWWSVLLDILWWTHWSCSYLFCRVVTLLPTMSCAVIAITRSKEIHSYFLQTSGNIFAFVC
jgi:hypothetical protein